MQVYWVLQLWREPWLASDSCVVLASSPHCSLLSLSPLMLAHCAHRRLMLAYPPPEKPWFSSAYLASWPPPTRKMPRFKLENSFQLDYLLPHNIATRLCISDNSELWFKFSPCNWAKILLVPDTSVTYFVWHSLNW